MQQQIYIKIICIKLGKNKKIKVNKTINFTQLKQRISKSIPQLMPNFIIYHINQDQQKQDIDDDNKNTKKIYVKNQEDSYVQQSLDISKFQSLDVSKIQENNNNSSSQVKSLMDKSKKESSLHQQESQEHNNSKNISGQSQNKINKQSSFSKAKQKSFVLAELLQNNKQIQQPQSSIVKQSQLILTQLVHDIPCKSCKSTKIYGKRYKSLVKLNYDLCNTCFNKLQQQNKHENYLQIDTKDYFSKINYYSSIKKLFNPQYKEEIVNQDQVQPWISQQDILTMNQKAVKQIQYICEPLANKINSHMDQWIRQYQSISRR